MSNWKGCENKKGGEGCILDFGLSERKTRFDSTRLVESFVWNEGGSDLWT